MNITETIFQQFGANKAMVMIGGRAMSEESRQTLHIQFKGSRNAKLLTIKLEANDTYTMKFFKVKKYIPVVVKEIQGVYSDMLKDVFEDFTKLYLSL